MPRWGMQAFCMTLQLPWLHALQHLSCKSRCSALINQSVRIFPMMCMSTYICDRSKQPVHCSKPTWSSLTLYGNALIWHAKAAQS